VSDEPLYRDRVCGIDIGSTTSCCPTPVTRWAHWRRARTNGPGGL